MLGDLTVLKAEEVGRREVELVAAGGASEEWAVLRSCPVRPRHDLVADGKDFLDLAMIIAEPLE